MLSICSVVQENRNVLDSVLGRSHLWVRLHQRVAYEVHDYT